MGIECQEVAGEMATGPPQFAQSDLELLGLLHGMGTEQLMDRLIGGHKGQAVGEFKALLAEGASLANAGDTERGFMDQLEGQARFDRGGGAARPAPEQIPGAQP